MTLDMALEYIQGDELGKSNASQLPFAQKLLKSRPQAQQNRNKGRPGKPGRQRSIELLNRFAFSPPLLDVRIGYCPGHT